jgi:hypothetical protein
MVQTVGEVTMLAGLRKAVDTLVRIADALERICELLEAVVDDDEIGVNTTGWKRKR